MAKDTEKVRWERIGQFGGLDWSRDHHDIVVVNLHGQVSLELRINDDADGWHRLREKLGELVGPDLSAVAVAIETNCGPVVERLLELGCTVCAPATLLGKNTQPVAIRM